ncbi:MAG: PulJ/GspJ family protein [Minisyncoccota bacterium]
MRAHSFFFRHRGFTLVETVVVIFFFSMLMYGVVSLFVAILKNTRQQSTSLDNVYQATMISSNFVNQLRSASYGNDGSYPLNQAGDTQVIFYSGLGGSGTTVQRIRYYLSGSTLYKGVVVPTGSPLSYNLGSETVSVVVTNLSTGGSPLFAYYDGAYDGSTSPLAQPVNVNQVKFVNMNLPILKNTELSTNTIVVSAGATIRNLKTNLGN